MTSSDTTGPPARWTQDVADAAQAEYRQDLRLELQRYVQQADRHTLRLIQKFIASLDR